MFESGSYYKNENLRSKFSPDLDFLRSLDIQDKLNLDDSLQEQEAYMSELFEDETLNSHLGDVYKAVKANEVINRLFAMAGIRSVDLIQLGEEIDKLRSITQLGEYIDVNGIKQKIPLEEAKEAERLALKLFETVKSQGFDQTSLKFRFNRKAPVVAGSSFNNHFNNIVGLLEEAKRDNKSVNMAFFGVTSPELVEMITRTADAEGMKGKVSARFNETYGGFVDEGIGGQRHEASLKIIEAKLGQNLMAKGQGTMHAKFMGIGLDGDNKGASFFIGSPNLTRAAMSMTRPVSNNIESGIVFNWDYFSKAYIGTENPDTAFARIMSSAREASNYLFQEKYVRPLGADQASLAKSGVVTGADLISANYNLLDKATALVKAGERVKVTLTTFSLSDDVNAAYNRKLRALVEAGGTVELIVGRKFGNRVSLEDQINKVITSALSSGQDRVLVRAYQRGIVHSKRTIISTEGPDGRHKAIASLEESGNKSQLGDNTTINVGMLLLGSEFDLSHEQQELEFLSRGIQMMGTSRIWDQGMDAVARGVYGAIQERIRTTESELANLDPGSLRLKSTGSGDTGYITLEMYKGKHKLTSFSFGRRAEDGRLFSATFNKFITPVVGAVEASNLNKLTRDARKNLDFEFDEYQVLAAAVSGVNSFMNKFVAVLEAQLNMSYNQIMRDSYLRSYIKIIASKQLRSMFGNFASPEEGLTNYVAKQESARLIFSQQNGLLDLNLIPDIDATKIHNSLDLLDAINKNQNLGNMTGYLITDRPFIYRAGGMSKFRPRSGQNSAARIFNLDDFINYLPIGEKIDDDYMFMLPLSKAFQLVGRLGNIMSARAMDLSQMSSINSGRELKGKSLFKSGNPSEAAREGLRLQGYMLMGMTGDVGYLNGSYWDGEYVARDNIYTQTWLTSRVSPIQLGEFKTRLLDLPDTFIKLKALAEKVGITEFADASVYRVGGQLVINREAADLIKSLHHMSKATQDKKFGNQAELLRSMMPGMRVFYDDFLAIEEIKTKLGRMVTGQGLLLDLDSMRVERSDKGTWNLSVGTKIMESLGSGMRFIANTKAPINVHDGSSDLFTALDSLDPETNLFKGPANVVMSSRLFKSGDMFIQTGLEVIKNQEYANKLIGKFNVGNKAKKLASLRGLFNRLGLSEFYSDLASGTIDLSVDINKVRGQISGKSGGISMKDRRSTAVTALMFVLHAESDLEIYTKQLANNPGARRAIGKYQDSTLDESILENLGFIGAIRIAGYATLAANNTPISSRPTVAMLGYFMDDTSYHLRRSVARDTRAVDATVDGLAALMGYRSRNSLVVGRSMQELQGFSLSNAGDITNIALESAKQVDTLSIADLIKSTSSMAASVAKIKMSSYLSGAELIESGDIGLLTKYLEAQKRVGIGSRTLYIPKLGQTESGRWISYDYVKDLAGQKSRSTDFIAIRMLDPNTLLNYAVYDNYAGEVARLQIQIENMLPDLNKMFNMFGDQTYIKHNLSGEEAEFIDKFMNLVIRLQGAQENLMATDNQKFMGGEIRGSGYNLIPVAESNVFFRDEGYIRRDMAVIGDEVYSQEIAKVRDTIARSTRKQLRQEVSKLRKLSKETGTKFVDLIPNIEDIALKNLISAIYRPVETGEVFETYYGSMGLEDIGNSIGKHLGDILKGKSSRHAVIRAKANRLKKLNQSTSFVALEELEARVTNNAEVLVKLQEQYDTLNEKIADGSVPVTKAVQLKLLQTRQKIKDMSRSFAVNLRKAKAKRQELNLKFGIDETNDDIQMLDKYLDIKNDYIETAIEKSLPEGANREEAIRIIKQSYSDPMVRKQVIDAVRAKGKAERNQAVESYIDQMLSATIDEFGGLPLIFFRAGAPVGAPGMVTLKGIPSSEYVEKYEGFSHKAGNTHSLIINPDIMSIFFGDTDGDSASIALMNRYVELTLNKKMGLLSEQDKIVLDQIDAVYNQSIEERFIEHAYRTAGFSTVDNDLKKVNSLVDLYFGEKGDVDGIGIQARMAQIQGMMKELKAGTISSKGRVELDRFNERLQSHYEIARKINRFAADLYEAADQVVRTFGGTYAGEDITKDQRGLDIAAKMKESLLKQYSLFGGQAGGMTKLTSQDIESIMQVVSISATKMIGLTFNSVDNLNRVINREVARANYKLYEELINKDSKYVGLDPRDAFSVIEREYKDQISVEGYNQVKDYHNFYTGINQMIQQAVRDAIKPKDDADMRKALDTMNEKGAGVFLVGGDINAGTFVDALRVVITGKDMGLTGEELSYDLTDTDTLKALQNKFVDSLSEYLNSYSMSPKDQTLLDLIGGEDKIKTNTREVANSLFLSLLYSDAGDYEKKLKAYSFAANSEPKRFFKATADISLEDKILMYEQLSSRGKFVNADGLRLATEDLVYGLSGEVDVKAKILRETGNANLAEVMERLVLMNKINSTKVDMADEMKKSNIQNDMYLKASRMRTLESSLGLGDEYGQDKLRAKQAELMSWTVEEYNTANNAALIDQAAKLDDDNKIRYRQTLELQRLLIEQERYQITDPHFEGFKSAGSLSLEGGEHPLRASSYSIRKRLIQSATHGSVSRAINDGVIPGFTAMGMMIGMGINDEDQLAESFGEAIGASLAFGINPIGSSRAMLEGDRQQMAETGTVLVGSSVVGLASFKGFNHILEGRTSALISNLLSSIGSATVSAVAAIVATKLFSVYKRSSKHEIGLPTDYSVETPVDQELQELEEEEVEEFQPMTGYRFEEDGYSEINSIIQGIWGFNE